MNGYLSVKSWDKYQQYKDGRPMLFIRVDVGVLDDYELDQLTEVQQNHLMRIWLLAGRCGNKIINDSEWIGKKIGAKSKVDIKQFVTRGLLIAYDTVQDRTIPYDASEVLALEKKRKEKKRKDKPNGQTSFALWWADYPKKKAKQDALKAWTKLKPDQQLQTKLLADIRNRVKNDSAWIRDNGDYVPNGATYLNGKRWEDSITPINGDGGGLPKDRRSLEKIAVSKGLHAVGNSPMHLADDLQYRRWLEGKLR